MTPLRIAAHISAAEWGGAERRSLALLAGLAARGHDIAVYCNTPRIAGKAREHGLHAVISPLRGDVMIGNALTLARRLRDQRPDVLLLITFRRLLLGSLAGRLARVPRIVCRVGLATDVARSTKYRLLLRHWIDDVVVNAESLLQPFLASLPPRARVRVHVIPNGVEPRPATLARETARSENGIPADAFVVGCVARLVKQKRFDRLIEAVAQLDDVHAVIAGDGYMREALHDLAHACGVADRVHFLGHREDVGNVHRMLDVYVVSSDQEGMSSGMLEAMAAGLPIVSTRVSGAAEALTASSTAGVITDFDHCAIAGAIRRLMQDDAARHAMGAAAADMARARFSADAMIDRWEVLLLERAGIPE
ncbi:MAG TPA: glycosyltransferase [Longimicrobiales bacterium]